jgi:hypothetical protein
VPRFSGTTIVLLVNLLAQQQASKWDVRGNAKTTLA